MYKGILRGTLLALFIVPLMSPPELAGQASSPASPRPRALTPRSVVQDFGYILSSPLRISKRNGLAILGFTAATSAVILVLDERIDEEYAVEDHRFPFEPVDQLAEVGRLYDRSGRIELIAGLSGGMVLGGLASGNHELVKTAGLMLESVTITSLITVTAKYIFGRSRPYTDAGALDFNLLEFRNIDAQKSIPSGHTSTIFAMMTVIAKRHPKWWVKVPAYTFALAVAFERMDSRNHWASDVLVGGSLGYLIGNGIARRYAARPSKSALRPYVGAGAIGMQVSW